LSRLISSREPCDRTAKSFAALKQLIERQGPKGFRRVEALKHQDINNVKLTALR
jgi:hypothetical protein